MFFTDIDAELSSKMEKDIKENTLKQQKKEEDYLLNLQKEKTKQDEIKKNNLKMILNKKN